MVPVTFRALWLCVGAWLLVSVSMVFSQSYFSLENSSTYLSSRVTSSLLFLFTYEEGQQNSSLTVSDDLSGNSILPTWNTNAAWIGNTPGVLLATSQSSTTSFSLTLTSISTTNQFSLEFWAQSSMETQTNVLLSTGAPTLSLLNPCSSNAGILIFQQGNSLSAYVVGNQRQCSSVFASLVPATSMFHVVLVATSSSLTLYMNGVEASFTVFTPQYSNWNGSGMLSAGPWGGSLFLLAVYNRALSATDVSTNTAARLPNAKPQPSPLVQIVTTQEHSFTVLSQLHLDATDQNQPTSQLTMRILQLPTTLTLQASTLSSYSFQIITLPFFFSNQTLFALQTPVGVFGSNRDSFQFVANDGFGDGRAGVVEINVQHSYIPPLADSLNATLYASSQSMVSFSGVVEDKVVQDNSSMMFRIESMPALGSLHLLNGTIVSQFPFTSTTNQFMYSQSTPFTTSLLSSSISVTVVGALNSTVAVDVVRFSVISHNTSSSNVGVASFQIVNPLSIGSLVVQWKYVVNQTINVSFQFPFDSKLNKSSCILLIKQSPALGTVWSPSGQALLSSSSSSTPYSSTWSASSSYHYQSTLPSTFSTCSQAVMQRVDTVSFAVMDAVSLVQTNDATVMFNLTSCQERPTLSLPSQLVGNKVTNVSLLYTDDSFDYSPSSSSPTLTVYVLWTSNCQSVTTASNAISAMNGVIAMTFAATASTITSLFALTTFRLVDPTSPGVVSIVVVKSNGLSSSLVSISLLPTSSSGSSTAAPSSSTSSLTWSVGGTLFYIIVAGVALVVCCCGCCGYHARTKYMERKLKEKQHAEIISKLDSPKPNQQPQSPHQQVESLTSIVSNSDMKPLLAADGHMVLVSSPNGMYTLLSLSRAIELTTPSANYAANLNGWQLGSLATPSAAVLSAAVLASPSGNSAVSPSMASKSNSIRVALSSPSNAVNTPVTPAANPATPARNQSMAQADGALALRANPIAIPPAHEAEIQIIDQPNSDISRQSQLPS